MPQNGDVDVSVMWNTVTGEKNGVFSQTDYYMWVDSDPENHISSMGRATAYPASISAVLMGRGRFDCSGIVAPEDAFDTELYKEMLHELEKRGIIIKESTS